MKPFPSTLSGTRLAVAMTSMVLWFAVECSAMTRTVTSNGDSGAGTLRDTLAASNNSDVINFSITGQINLTTGELDVTKNVTITGPGAAQLTVTRTAGDFCIFVISSGVTVSISSLTITNGAGHGLDPDEETVTGGGITNNEGTLTVSNCTINGCTADAGGAIYNEGTLGGGLLTLAGCTFSGNSAAVYGGTIYTDHGQVTASYCTFSGNNASGSGEGGGAILNFAGQLTINNCAFSSNSAPSNNASGGAIANVGLNTPSTGIATVRNSTFNGNNTSANGGAIYNLFGTVILDNNTFANNTAFAGGAVNNRDATVTLRNCTLTGNSASRGGAVYDQGINGGAYAAKATVSHCTFSDNTASFAGDSIYNKRSSDGFTDVILDNNILKAGAVGNFYDEAIPFSHLDFASEGYNLSSDSAYLTAASDQVNTDPMLGPLQDNGGPTFTQALLPGSPAIDKGNGTLTTDQRGAHRPFDDPNSANGDGNNSDIGAFEFQSTPAVVLANISTRLHVATDDNVLIGGFIITGTEPKKVIVRAIGPSLTQFGITDPLQNPTLDLHDGSGAIIATNDNWGDAANHQDISNSGLAPGNGLESAILITLHPGNYTVILQGKDSTVGTALVEAYDLDRTVDSKLGNISTRGQVLTNDGVLIGGLIVSGNGSKDVIVRAIGPSLVAFGITDALSDPTLELHDGNGVSIAINDNWKDTQRAQIQATGLAPSQDAESAIVQTLAPGNYTALVKGKNDTTGVGLIEVYGLN